MGKSKAQLAQEARWNPKVAAILVKAKNSTVEDGLALMGVAVRSAENAIARLTYLSKTLRREIHFQMIEHGISEYRASRMTFLRLDDVFTIKKNDAGQAAYERLVARFGKKFAKSLVSIRKERIPATIDTIFEIDEAFLQEQDSATRKEIAKALGHDPKLYVGDVPKRVKTGGARRKREGNTTRKR